MSQQQWNSGENDDVQMPLGVGGGGAEQDFSVEGSGKPKFSGPTVVLFGAFALALVVIYALGLQNKPRPASAEQVAHEQAVQSAISELLQKNGKEGQLNGLFQDTDKLVKMFYSYLGTQSEGPPELPHDPFANDDVRSPASPEETAVVPSNFAEAEKLRKVAETFSGLKLQSVMLGKTSVAMINNRMVTVGAKLGELTVGTIESGRVILTYENNKFELKLYHPAADQE